MLYYLYMLVFAIQESLAVRSLARLCRLETSLVPGAIVLYSLW
jgi:hypothetical protein